MISTEKHIMKHNLFVIFVIYFYFLQIVESTSKSIKIEKMSLCPNNKKLLATVIQFNTFNTNGKLCVNAEVNVTEKITGPIMVKKNQFLMIQRLFIT